MALSNGIRKYRAVIFFVMFFASASFAAANNLALPNLGLQSDTGAQTMHQTNETLIKTPANSNSACFSEYFTNFGGVITALERKDTPVGSLNGCLTETPAIALHKDGDKIIWSLAPSFDRFSLNPIDDIKKLHVLLQYKFWF